MRKILALLMAALMIVSLGISAAAATSTDDDGSFRIIIDNAVNGETYTAYKIFNLTYSGDITPPPTPADAADIPGAADESHMHTAYSYTISSTSEWWSVIVGDAVADSSTGVITANGLTFVPTTTENVYNVHATENYHPAEFAALLDANKDGKTVAATASSVTVTSGTNHPSDDTVYYTTGTAELTVSAPGYYFIDTSLGSLCSLDSTEPVATIREKNSMPTVEKTVSDTANGTFGTSTDVDIGDTVYYKITVTDGTGTDAEIKVHDVLSEGQTLVTNSFKVLNGTDAVDSDYYTIIYSGSASVTTDTTTYTEANGYVAASPETLGDDCTFEVVFDAAYVTTLDPNSPITVTYSAILNENAIIVGEGNPNTATLTYSNHTTPESLTKVYTYAGAIYKFNSHAEELPGATFTMADANGAQMYFIQIDAGSATTPAVYRYSSLYTSATDSATPSLVTPASGAIVICGLDVGSYTLTETAAPEGYNKLTETKMLTVEAASAALSADVSFPTTTGSTAVFEAGADDINNNVTYQLSENSVLGVENNSGTELPSTGGIGTTIFYIVGGLLAVGAGVVLVTKKIMSREEK